MNKQLGICLALTLLAALSCVGDKQFAQKVKKAMKDDPTVLTDAIQANPVEFMETLSKVAQSSRQKMQERRVAKEIEEGINNPKKPNIRPDDAIRGTRGAPLTLVEYSDFECPFCTRGFATVQGLLKKYEGKIQFIYKHLPLSFHPNAMIASQYYEAARLQGEKKAFDIHDKIFANQGKLKGGEKFLKKLAREVGGLDMKKLIKDAKSAAVKKRIQEDAKEAAKMGFQGTPGFLINGIAVRGAMPVEYFERIIEKLKAAGKVTL